jgi:hypothetical protein
MSSCGVRESRVLRGPAFFDWVFVNSGQICMISWSGNAGWIALYRCAFSLVVDRCKIESFRSLNAPEPPFFAVSKETWPKETTPRRSALRASCAAGPRAVTEFFGGASMHLRKTACIVHAALRVDRHRPPLRRGPFAGSASMRSRAELSLRSADADADADAGAGARDVVVAVVLARRSARSSKGPLRSGAGWRISPQGGRQDVGHRFVGTRMCRRNDPSPCADPRHMDVPWALRWGVLSFGYLFFGHAKKSDPTASAVGSW